MFVKPREKCKQRTAPAARNFWKIIFLIRRIDEIFGKRSAGNKRAALATFGVARGQGRMARLERRDLRNKRRPRSDGASEKKHLGMTTLLCGATFQGLESARQTALTKRKVYEDFTTTLMRRRENRVWPSYWQRRREPSWGKKTTRVGKETPMKGISTALFALLCLSITQDRVLRSGPYARRFGRGHRRFSLRREQRRRTKLGEFGKCKVSRARTGFQV